LGPWQLAQLLRKICAPRWMSAVVWEGWVESSLTLH
jgi:hypothetical protein